MKLLHIDSSILGAQSATRELGAAVVANWRREHPGGDVIHRDLAEQPLGHLTGALFAARTQPAGQAGADFRLELETSKRVLDEFLGADVIVIGAPMYNFSIPSQLKAWIDRIAVAGKTFRYTANGPEGLAIGKKVIIVSARGGMYGDGSAAAALDFQENYLRGLFGFLGVKDVEFVRAEGLSHGAAQRSQAMAAALGAIEGRLPIAA